VLEFTLCAVDVSERLSDTVDDVNGCDKTAEGETETGSYHVVVNILGRCFAVETSVDKTPSWPLEILTRRQWTSSGSNPAEEGAIIWILLGSSVLVALQPQDGGHTLLGGTYVYNYMYGNAIKELEGGQCEIESFEIHPVRFSEMYSTF
jgi:hypothetical protein